MKPTLLAAALAAFCLTGAVAAQVPVQADPAEQERYRQAQERHQRQLREAEAARLRYEADLARHRQQVERARRRQADYDRRMAERAARDAREAERDTERNAERRAEASPVAAPAEDRCQQQRERSRRRGRGIGGVLGSVAGGVIGGPAGGVANMVTSVLPVGALIGEAIASLLDCDEQQRAAAATEEAVRGGVGTTANWQSETREGVTGSSTVMAEEPAAADGSRCITVTDIVIVDGEETRAPKRMCRRPPANRYVRV